MSYFTAVLARHGKRWRASDLDVDDYDTLAELADALRDLASDDDPVLAVVEREDAWWAVVRVDGEEDPRVFVSDMAGAAASAYADRLELGDEADDDVAPGTCGGDLDVFADLGTTPERLREMCDEELLPIDALAEVAEPAGFGEVLDSLR